MSSLTLDRNFENIPKPILDKLRAVIRRARLVMIVRGMFAVLLTAVLALLIGMAIDASFTIFSTEIRAAISATLLISVIASLYFFLVRPLSKSFTLTGIARIVESRRPELQERLSSAVQLLSSKESSDLRGSEALIGELSKEAVGQINTISPASEFSLKAALPFFVAALSVWGILGAMFLAWPDSTSRLFNRIVAPFANIGNVQATDIQVSPGDITIAKGDPLRIEISVDDMRVRSAKIRVLAVDSERETYEPMTMLSNEENGKQRFFVSLPAADENFRYRVHAGGALTRYFDVQVVPRPQIEDLTVTYNYPAYMNRPDKTVSQWASQANQSRSGKTIKGPVGTRVKVAATISSIAKVATLKISGLKPIVGEISTQGEKGIATFEFPLTGEFLVGRTWNIQVEDSYQFENWATDYFVKSIKDLPPSIQITSPSQRAMRLRRTDSFPIQYRGEDDFGIAKAELIATIDGRDPISTPISIEPNLSLISGNETIDLNQIVKSGDRTVTIQLRVEDNLPAELMGSQNAVSETITITIDQTADSFFETQAAADYASIKELLEKVLADLNESQTKSKSLPANVKTDARLEKEVTDTINRIRDLAKTDQEEMLELALVLPDTTFSQLTGSVTDVAENDIQQIHLQAGRIKLVDVAEKRSEHATEAVRNIDSSIQKVESIIAKLDEIWKQIQELSDLKELASKQAELAEAIEEAAVEANDPDATNPDAPEDAELPLLEEQLEVIEQIAEEIKSTPEALIPELQEQKSAAEDLVEKAQDLAEKQADLAELTNDLNQPNQDPEDLKNKIADAIAQQQEEIAKEAQELDKEIEKADLAGDDKQSDLEEKAESTLEEIEKEDFKGAAEEAKEAAEDFEKAAQALEQNESVPDAKADDAIADDAKADDAKADDAKADDAKSDDAKSDDAKADDAKSDDAKADDAKADDAKADDAKADDAKSGDEKADDAKADDAKADDAKADDAKADDAKSDDAKADDAKSDDAKELGDKASDLAERQEEVKKQLEALEKGDLEKALELMQNQIKKGVEDLAEKAEEVSSAAEQLSQTQESKEKAEEAKAEIQNAQEQSDKAEKQLAKASSEIKKAAEEKAAADAEKNQPQEGKGEQGEPESGEPAEGKGEQGEPESGEPAEGQGEQGEPESGEPAEGKGEQGEPESGEPAEGKGEQGEPESGEPAEGQGEQGEPESGEPAEGKGEQGEPESGEPSETNSDASGTPAGSKEKTEAVQAQQSSAQSLRNAADALRELADDLAEQAESSMGDSDAENSLSTNQSPTDLNEAFEAANSAAEALQNPNADPAASQAAAAENANAAAQALAEAAAQKAAEIGQASPSQTAQSQPPANNPSNSPSSTPSNQPSTSPSPPGQDGKEGNPAGEIDNSLNSTLKEYGISVRQWTRLPGSLKNKIRQAEADGAPEEYRAMVRQYFRGLAKRGSSEKSK